MNNSKYVQYGCGWTAPKDWRNFDGSPTLRFERLPIVGGLYTKNAARFPDNVEYGDIVKGLPVADCSCSAVYCSHVLEHLALSDCKISLQNTLKMLQPRGFFRMVLPDLEYAIHKYVNDSSENAAANFLLDTSLGFTHRQKGLRSLASAWLGNSRHLWMWDYKSLKAELEAAGFVDVRRASFADSVEPAFLSVEDASRWKNCLGIECRKSG